jgi:hypothetical protein
VAHAFHRRLAELPPSDPATTGPVVLALTLHDPAGDPRG